MNDDRCRGACELPDLTATGSARSRQLILRIAHRGIQLRGPDPVLACRAVRAEGAHLIEVDARVTADGQLVVAHDPWIADRSGERCWIADESATAVTASDSRILLLSDVLTAIAGCGIGLYLDIKSIDAPAARWIGVALRDSGLSERSVLASSRSDVVALCSRELPELPRAVLFASDTEDPVQLAAAVDAQFVHPCWERFPAPHQLLTTRWVERVRSNGLGIVSWHEERREVLDALAGIGVDGICTDDVPLLTTTIEQAGGPTAIGASEGATAS